MLLLLFLRWRKAKEEEEGGAKTRARRPHLASECDNVSQAEIWRQQVGHPTPGSYGSSAPASHESSAPAPHGSSAPASHESSAPASHGSTDPASHGSSALVSTPTLVMPLLILLLLSC